MNTVQNGKTRISNKLDDRRWLVRSRFALGSFVALLSLGGASARAQTLYVTSGAGGSEVGTITSYSLTGPNAGQANQFALLDNPIGDTVLGTTLYVAVGEGNPNGPGLIEQYPLVGPNAGQGSVFATANVDNPISLVGNGTNLYVGNQNTYTPVPFGTGYGYIEQYAVAGPTAGNLSASQFALLTSNGFIEVPYSMVVAGTNLYAASNYGNIEEFSLAGPNAGTASETIFASPPGNPEGLAIFGTDLYVSTQNNNILQYSLLNPGAGPTVFASTGLNMPGQLAVSGTSLYAASTVDGTIEQYSLIGPNAGDASAAIFASGLTNPFGLAVDPEEVPEPSTWALMVGGLSLLGFWKARKRQT